MVGAAVALLGVILALPLAAIFAYAFSRGVGAFAAAVTSPDAVAAMRLSLVAIAIAVPLNTVFGLAAAWALTRYQFRGKAILTSLIDLPIAVSPVVAGFVIVLLFGVRGPIGTWLASRGIQVVYATPGIVLATIFVTFPLVARELIPLMNALGSEEEHAAASLGANAWQTFWRVTLPNIRWGLLYGVVVCVARAVGEFGAVSVVSGHIRGETNTLPLHVEILHNENDAVGAFAVASLVTVVGLFALGLKKFMEWRLSRLQGVV